ncbi:nuclear transport factor 2 family protein [Lysobacter sp. D1-1-M9]|uniref:nuclear transport factor 2 family protein n=1 Tax=Novilysobacter longmucuonensis TaxID=3098603 RepID=UPI002FCC1BA7
MKLIPTITALSSANLGAKLSPRPRSHRMSISSDAAIDYDGLMQANLTRVFGERDAGRRLGAIRELYAEDAVLNEPHASARGHIAIRDAVIALHASLPSNFDFTAIRPATGHHGIGRLQWRAGPPGGPAVAAGTDIANFKGGRIHSLTVFLDHLAA